MNNILPQNEDDYQEHNVSPHHRLQFNKSTNDLKKTLNHYLIDRNQEI